MSADFGLLRERMVRDQLQARGIASAPVLASDQPSVAIDGKRGTVKLSFHL